MKTLYFDCFSGISGDMTLAALVDLGVPEAYVSSELEKLNIDGIKIEFKRVEKNGIGANYANVITNDQGQPHRNHNDIVKIIDTSEISEGAKEIAKKIFDTIARAEAKVHNTSVEDVHFHEVGALDSIADVVCAGICIDYLKPEKIISSVVNDGRGFSFCRHGKIPVPVPAVMEIFAAKKIKFNQLEVEGELVTPTGAGIIASVAESFGPVNNLEVIKTGYGAGRSDFTHPNLLRVCLCEAETEADTPDTVTEIRANIDDQTPETLSYAMEKLLEAGAKDVFFTPTQMKKNRPGCMLTVICNNNNFKTMADIIFLNTKTFGIRYEKVDRICIERGFSKVPTPYGEVCVKIGHYGDIRKITPEYESAKELAIKNNIPIDEIYRHVYKYEI